MSLDTYANLILEVTDLLNRGDLAGKVPTWIALVEDDLRLQLDGRDMRTDLAFYFDTTGQMPLPVDFIRPVSLTVQSDLFKGPVDLTSYERLQQKIQQLVTGPPRYAAIYGSTMFWNPTDDDTAYPGVLWYDAELAPLTALTPTNWLLTKHPTTYLYGCCVHSAPYLKDDERLAVWGEFYGNHLTKIRKARDRAEFGANTPIVKRKSALGA